MINKKGLVFASIFLMFIFSINFVSAAGAADAFRPIVEMIAGLIGAVAEALGPVLGDSDTSSDLFMAKLLMSLIVLSVVYFIMGKVPPFNDPSASGYTWVKWVVSIGVAILGVRFLDSSFVYTAVLSNSVLAVALVGGLPFILWFNLVKDWQHSISRKIAWIFFGVIYVFLWSSFITEGQISGIATVVYPVVVGLAFLMAFMDGTYQRWKNKQSVMKTMGAKDIRIYTGLLATIEQKEESLRLLYQDPVANAGLIRTTEGEIAALRTQLARKYPTL